MNAILANPSKCFRNKPDYFRSMSQDNRKLLFSEIFTSWNVRLYRQNEVLTTRSKYVCEKAERFQLNVGKRPKNHFIPRIFFSLQSDRLDTYSAVLTTSLEKLWQKTAIFLAQCPKLNLFFSNSFTKLFHNRKPSSAHVECSFDNPTVIVWTAGW